MAITVPDINWFDSRILQARLDSTYPEVRDEVREIISRPEFDPPLGISTPEYRELCLQWCKTLADANVTRWGAPGPGYDPGAVVAMFEVLSLGDLSLLIKFGVQFGLWGGAVHHLGTAQHHERYSAQIASLELPGCFAMTETGHGSNVQQL